MKHILYKVWLEPETFPTKYPSLMDYLYIFSLSFPPSTIANLLQCDVMMHLMQTILDRALDLKRKSFQENHLQKVCIGFKFEALFF